MKRNPLKVLQEFPELAQWIKSICRYNKVEDFVQVDYKEKLRLTIYTKEHEYHISARLPKVEKLGKGDMLSVDGYLGCIAKTRKPRAGEDWTRGNDLADGKYCKETWDRIVHDILGYELVKVVKPRKRVIDSTNPEISKNMKII